MGDTVATLVARLVADVKDFDRNIKTAESRVKEMGGKFDDAGKKMQALGGKATRRMTLPIVGAVGASVKAMIDFESGMTESMAIMGDVSDDTRQRMEQAARDVAKTTTHSHREAADSYFYLASAGMDAEASIAALPQVAAFAQAGAFDMARATDIATDAQSALGLASDDAAKNLEGLTRVTDVFVRANQLANTSVEEVGEAMMRAGPGIRGVNKDVEEGTAILAAMADQGLKGASAGTQLRTVMEGLPRAARQNAEEFEKVGLSIFDADGEMRNFADITRDFEKVMGDLSPEMQGAMMDQLGLRGHVGNTMRMMLGQSDAIAEYERELRSAGGAVDEVANKQLESLGSQLELAKSGIVDFAITIGQDLAPMVGDMVAWLQRAGEWFGNLDESQRRTILVVAGVVAAFGPVMIILGTIVRAVGAVIKGVGSLIKVFGMLGKALMMVGKTLLLVGKFMLANPIVLIVMAIAVAAYLIYKHWDKISAFFVELWAAVTRVFQQFVDWVKGIWDGVVEWVSGAWQGVIGFFSGLWGSVKDAFGEAVDLIVGLLLNFTPAGLIIKHWKSITGWFSKLWGSIGKVFTGATGKIVSTVSGWRDRVMRLATGLRDRFVAGVTRMRDLAVGAATSLRDRFVSGVQGLRDRAVSLATGLRDRVVSLATGLRDRVVAVVTSLTSRFLGDVTKLRSGAVDRFRALVDWVRGLPKMIIGALGNVGGMLFGAGKKIVQGLIDGVKNMGNAAKDAVKGVASKMRNMLPFSPAKEGPFSGRGHTLYSGEALVGDLAKGIMRAKRSAESAARDVASAMARELSVASAPVPMPSAGAAAVRRFEAAMAPAAGRREAGQVASEMTLTLDLGEGITQRYRIERTREGRARAVRMGGR